ncbi:MAG TPA: Gfo/Idh/MocA family oxidoreductase [Chthonomonadaceae bacterium]|nr:Gfo/Idh/MocA family oxidoreductase [Chthonomonadaceae bacterium]
MLRIGVIGYGGRIQGVIELMQRLRQGTEIVAITDVRNDEIRKRMRDRGQDDSKVAFYTDPEAMLDTEKLDGVMIGTRCSLHARMAIKVLQRNLPLFLEKPIATNMHDLLALRAAAARSTSEVVVSFPLRVTPLVQLAKEIIDSAKIGTVEHVQAWNNVPYGWVYYQGWYRDENETQGLFLQKATHDFDYINYLIGIQPRWICAMTSKQIMKGSHPAGLRCDDCTEHDTCLESPFHYHFSKGERDRVQDTGLLCAFATDTGNEDSGSAIIQYETGMHVNYSQNFFARKGAGKRGATLLGYKGTVEFDWYTDEVKVFMHHTPRVETIKMQTSSLSHGGGDTVLADNFVRVVRGERKSVSPLSAGLLSVLMCLKAKESAATRTFQEVAFPDAAPETPESLQRAVVADSEERRSLADRV